MSDLAAQHIRIRCLRENLVYPFHERTMHEQSGMSFGLGPASYDIRLDQDLYLEPGQFGLFSTIEIITMPDDLSMRVMDKSTLARRGLSVQNTHFDPGFVGFATLEIDLKPGAREPVRLIRGAPIAQIVFTTLTAPTEQPYNGKYQNQQRGPQPHLLENKAK